MGTSKDDTIKFRVNAQLKADFKDFAESNNTNMSEIFTQYMIEILDKDKFRKDNHEIIYKRSKETEIKLSKIKTKLINKTKKSNKFNFIELFKIFIN